MIERRALGERSVSYLGLGCWAIGGPAFRGDEPMGWGDVDDRESIRAIHCALDHGVNLFDTADMYGCGHSERVLQRALDGRPEEVTVVTKFGYRIDEDSRQITGQIRLPDDIESACDASLSRLGRDVIDVYLLHLRDLDPGQTSAVQEALEALIERGKIRSYGWSTDDPERARLFLPSEHYVGVEQAFNLFQGNRETLAVCEDHDLASLQRSPLAMGLLSGKFSGDHRAEKDDVRARFDFADGPVKAMLDQLARIRESVTSDGGTLVQGALRWLWANSPVAIPIPGFRTVGQVEELASSMNLAPLSADAMASVHQARNAIGAMPANPWDLSRRD